MKVRRPHIYEATAWLGGVGGASDTRQVTLAGYAKLDSMDGPLCVANEYICSRIGELIGVPVPPGAMLRTPTGGRAWVTLSFSNSPLPPIDPVEVARAVPLLAAEVVVFDILIANYDRHSRNLAFMPGPKRLEVFDHSHALMGHGPSAGIAVLGGKYRDLGIDGAIGNRHCLLDQLKDARTIKAAVEGVSASVTDRTLRRICSEAAALRLGVSQAEATALADMLIMRRDGLEMIVRANEAEFRGVPAADWSTI